MREHTEVVVSCALTGSIHTPSMSPHLPVTPEELVAEGVAAAEAGASIVHVHVRDPETGEPSPDLDLFEEVAAGIRAETDAIVQPTTGGAMTMSVEERAGVVPRLEPETASCNMGSMNFGLHPIIDAVDEFEHDWEPEFLEATRGTIFANTFSDVEHLLPLFDDHGTTPELECYDVGHLYNVQHFLDRGLLEAPIHLQFVMGILGGIGADPENLSTMKRTADKLFGGDYSFSVVGAGRNQFSLGTQAAAMGGHVRVGLEDNLYLERGRLAESNAEQVERMVDLVWKETGREPATPEATREFLGFKGGDAVAF